MDLTGHVHLLLGAPGQTPPSLPDSAWRVTVIGATAMADPTMVASAIRVSPMTPRAEKALVAAVAAEDIDTIARLCDTPGPVQEAARVLYSARLVALDPEAAAAVLGHILAAPTDPAASKVLRRFWPGLHIATALAPSVPALLPVSSVAVGLLLAEVRSAQGRVAEALAVLGQLPPQPAVHLATAASLLATGEHARVLDITKSLRNTDDISALGLVARSVAARTLGDLHVALDAVCEALSSTDRSLGVLAAGLEERAHLYSLLKDDIAARADLEVLGLLAGGTQQVVVPEPARIRRTPEHDEEHSLDRARDRMRRRIMGVGEPGHFGGRHHSTYRDEIAEMFSLGKLAAVEELLLGLLDAVEDEVAELGVALDPTFFLTLADLYQDSGRQDDLVALRERYAAAEARAAHSLPSIGPDSDIEIVSGPVVSDHVGDPTLVTPPPPSPSNPFGPVDAAPAPRTKPAAPKEAAASLARSGTDAQDGPHPLHGPAVVEADPASAPATPPAPVAAPEPAVAPAVAAAAAPEPVVPPAAEPVVAPAAVATPPLEPVAPEPVAPEPVAAEPEPVVPEPVEPVVAAAPAPVLPEPVAAVPAPVVAEAPLVEPAAVAPIAVEAVVAEPEPVAPVVPLVAAPTPEPVAPAPVASEALAPVATGAPAEAIVEHSGGVAVAERPPAPSPTAPPVAAPAELAGPEDDPHLPARAREDGRTSLIAMAAAPVTPLTPSARAAAAAAAAEEESEEPGRELTAVERAIRGPRLRSL